MSFEVSFEELPRPVARRKRPEDTSFEVFPSRSEGIVRLSPQIDVFQITYCQDLSNSYDVLKSCTEIDRKSGEYEMMWFRGDSRTVVQRGVCEVKGRVSSKF